MQPGISSLRPRAIVNNCYILHELIGEDQFAFYWEASAIFAAEPFLIRFFKPSIWDHCDQEAFCRTVRSGLGTNNGAWLSAVEVDRFASLVFVVAPFSEFRSLRQLLEKQPRLTLLHIVQLTQSLIRGLAADHRQGQAYRLVNPDLVWLHQGAGIGRNAKLLHPGYGELLAAMNQIDPTPILATQAYLAPEIKGVSNHSVDARTDQYGVGVILFQLLTGRLPYNKDLVTKALGRAVSILHVAYWLRWQKVPESLIRVAIRLLRTNPAARYQSLDTVDQELSDLLLEIRRTNPSGQPVTESGGGDDALVDLQAFDQSQNSDAATPGRSSSPGELRFPTKEFFELAAEEWNRDRTLPVSGPTQTSDDEGLEIDQILDLVAKMEEPRIAVASEVALATAGPEPEGPVGSSGDEPGSKPAELANQSSPTPLEANYSAELRPDGATGRISAPNWDGGLDSAQSLSTRIRQIRWNLTLGRTCCQVVDANRATQYPGWTAILNTARRQGLVIEVASTDDSPGNFVAGIEDALLRTCVAKPRKFAQFLWRRVRASPVLSTLFTEKLRDLLAERLSWAETPSLPPTDYVSIAMNPSDYLYALLAVGTFRTPVVLIVSQFDRLTRINHDLLLNAVESNRHSHSLVIGLFKDRPDHYWHVLSR